MVAVPSLVELCFLTIMEKIEYNNEDLQRIPLNLIEKMIGFMVSKLQPSIDASLQTKPIRIKLVRQNRCITMKFSVHSNIDKIIHQIYDRVVNEEKHDYLEKTLRTRQSNNNNNSSSSISPPPSPGRLNQPSSPSSPSSPTSPTSPTTSTTSTTTTTTTTTTSTSYYEEYEDTINREETQDDHGFVSSWGDITNYGLFQQAGQFRNARWLNLDRTLADYDIDPNETLEFKNTKSVLKIKFNGPWERVVHPLHQSTMLLDETIKTFIVDESKTVSEISRDLGRKLSLRYPEELSLKKQSADDHDNGTWLVSDLTLPEQGIDPLYSIFFLKRQFFYSKDVIIDFSMDPDMLYFVFCQCLDAIIDCSHPCSVNEAILFAALQCQICFGNYRSGVVDSLRLKDFLPLEYINQKNIQKEIVVQYQRLNGMGEQKAKLNYIQLAKSLKTYGYTFFKVESTTTKSNSFTSSLSSSLNSNSNNPTFVLFGISSEAILILDPETKNTIHLYSLANVKKYQVLNNVFSIDFVDKKEKFISVESEAISYVLSSYIHYNLRNSPSIQKEWDLNYINVAKLTARRRLSSSSNTSISEMLEKKKDIEGVTSKKCPLYIEPKKLYLNPLFTLMNDDSSSLTKKELFKDTKVTKVMRALSDLSSKMIQSFSNNRASSNLGSQEREIVVKFSDKKVKTFVVDESKTVAEITQEIGNRVGIKNTEEFSLQIQINCSSNNNNNNSNNNNQVYNVINNNNSINNTNNNVISNSNNNFVNSNNLNNSMNNINFNNNNNNNNNSINSFYGNNSWIAGSMGDELSDGKWLRPYLPLRDQNINQEGAKFMFKKKFYTDSTSESDCNSDPVYFNLLFFQSRDAIISNTYACSMEESIQLAATLFQINFGDHNPTIHKSGFLKAQDLKFFLPSDCLELWGMSFQKIEKIIYKEHRNLRGIKEVYAKFRYVQLCRSLKTFGATFFTVKQKDKNHNPLLPSNCSLLLGFARKCILVMTVKTRKLLLEYPLSHLRKWSYNRDQQTFTLDFGDYTQGIFVLQAPEAEDISLYLSDYIDYLQTKMYGSQSFSKIILGN